MKITNINRPCAKGALYGQIQTRFNPSAWIALFFICSSCASVYIPSVRNVPLLSKGGEFQVSGSVGNGINVNAAYAIVNHVGLMGNAMYANNKLRHYTTFRTHQSAEAALGYFGNTKQFSYETYVGYGGGKGYAKDLLDEFTIFFTTLKITSGGYRKMFIQPTFAFTIKRFQLAVTTRVARVDFYRLSVTEDERSKNMPHKRFYFFEPSFTSKFIIREGHAKLFAFGQTGFSYTEQHGANESIMPYAALHYNVGIGLKL